MRTTSTLAFLASLASALPTSAQLLNVYESGGGALVNGGMVTVYGQPTDNIVSKQLPVILNGSNAMDVGVKRYEVSYPAGFTENYFCWYDCWNPDTTGDHPLWYAIDPYNLDPGVQFNGFYADYKPHGVSGMACFKFVWYAIADTTDSVSVDLCFDVYEGAGLIERTDLVNAFTVYPNPSLDGAVNMDLDLAVWTGREELIFRDATGRIALRRRIAQGERNAGIQAGALAPGMWFATLESGGEVLATRRITLAGH